MNYEGQYKIEEARPGPHGWTDYWAASFGSRLQKLVSFSVFSEVQLPIGAKVHIKSYSVSILDEAGGSGPVAQKRVEPPPMKLHPLTCGQCGSELAELGHGSRACQKCFGVRPL